MMGAERFFVACDLNVEVSMHDEEDFNAWTVRTLLLARTKR